MGIEQLSKTVIRIGKPEGKFYDKILDEIPLKDLDWLVGVPWLSRKYPIEGKLIEEYLNHPTIKKMLEEELSR